MIPVSAAMQTAIESGFHKPDFQLLSYDISSDTGEVVVRMTLTAPNCPMAGMIVMQVEAKVKAVEGVTAATVELVWDPPWTPDRMSEAAKLDAGIFDTEDDSPNKMRVLGSDPTRKWKP